MEIPRGKYCGWQDSCVFSNNQDLKGSRSNIKNNIRGWGYKVHGTLMDNKLVMGVMLGDK
jgi:hypothetical protein